MLKFIILFIILVAQLACSLNINFSKSQVEPLICCSFMTAYTQFHRLGCHSCKLCLEYWRIIVGTTWVVSTAINTLPDWSVLVKRYARAVVIVTNFRRRRRLLKSRVASVTRTAMSSYAPKLMTRCVDVSLLDRT